ncbi:MAG: hypothetical protein COA79_02645 [Planctomycetota bacterium]|nr:MAG: hypothetical protein COA79_02645 [Planctomycetota bacterium]
MDKTIKIGLLSIEISKEKKNTESFYEILFEECKNNITDKSFDIVLLPERAATKKSERQDLDGEIVSIFKKIAIEFKLFLIAPIVEKVNDKDYNNQIVISPEGKLIHTYRKVHLAPGEETTTLPGDNFGVFDLPWFKAGIMTCYDNHFPESSRCLAIQGARVIFWPSFGDLKKPHRNIARCIDNDIFLLSAGVVDESCELPAADFGTSQGIDPLGNELDSIDESSGLFKIVELPLDATTGKLEKSINDNIYLGVRQPNAYNPVIDK